MVVIWLWLVVEAIVVVVMVAWLALWLCGSDVCCCGGGLREAVAESDVGDGDLVVVGGGGDRGCGDGGVVGVVDIWERCWLL